MALLRFFSYVMHTFLGRMFVASTRFLNGSMIRIGLKVPAMECPSFAHMVYSIWLRLGHPGLASCHASLKTWDKRCSCSPTTSHQRWLRDWMGEGIQGNWNSSEMYIPRSHVFQAVLNLTVEIAAECTVATNRVLASCQRLLVIVRSSIGGLDEANRSKMRKVSRSWMCFGRQSQSLLMNWWRVWQKIGFEHDQPTGWSCHQLHGEMYEWSTGLMC